VFADNDQRQKTNPAIFQIPQRNHLFRLGGTPADSFRRVKNAVNDIGR
jgi:hypothetical protein